MHVAEQFRLPLNEDDRPVPFEFLEPEAAHILMALSQNAPRKFVEWLILANGKVLGKENRNLIGRNDKCWCGRGKYKNCHGKTAVVEKKEIQTELPM